ncbi:MAG: hypothetical protein SFV19_20500 [Rhodospirillaceae bacterium]|nr:hypothetical protein [Rhodospirillaceae bacterium]
MKPIRVFLAAMLLVWAPFSGAVGASLGVNLAHHHCDNAWHGHGDAALSTQAVPAHDTADVGHANNDPFSCEDCHIVMAALPAAGFMIEAPVPSVGAADTTATAQNVVAVSLFRPPRT